MKRMCALGLVIGWSLTIVGCSDTPAPAPDTRAADEKAIRDGETAWASDWTSKDANKILNHYADNATLMVPNAPVAKGKDAMSGMLKEMLGDKNLSLTFSPATVEVAKSGDIGYSQGNYEMTMTNPKTKKAVTEKGEYLTVYKKEPGGMWKAIEDINTPSGAAAPIASEKPARAAKGKAGRRRK